MRDTPITPPAPVATQPGTSRRALVRGAVLTGSVAGVVGLAGCRIRIGEETASGPSGSASPSPTGTASPAAGNDETNAATSDETRVARARQQTAEVAALVEDVSRRHRGVAPALSALAAMHTAHLAALTTDASGEPSGDPTAEPEPVPVPARSAAALDLIVARERTLATEFATLAGDAASGPLARALASMAAGVDQRVSSVVSARRGPA